MELTCQSEVGALQSVFIKPVSEAFLSPEKVASEWEDLNYLEPPDLPQAVLEFEAFTRILENAGAEVLRLPPADGLTLDALYCRDAAIATDHGMLICNMGKGARRAEPAAERAAFIAHDIPVLGAIESPGTLEGGDVAWLDPQTLAVGHTYRTNWAGIEQLQGMLQPLGVDVIVVDLPHYRGPGDVFHLMSILSPVAEDLAVVYSPLMPIGFRQQLLARGMQLVEVAEAEFEQMACNVLALSPRNCLMMSGNPATEAALKAAGCTVFTYAGKEISWKGGGGPTCLTRPVWRSRRGI